MVIVAKLTNVSNCSFRGRADSHEAKERLDAGNCNHTHDRCAFGCNLLQECREVAFISTGFEYVGDGKLPAKEGTEAGENHESHDDVSYCAAEHVGKYHSERRGGFQKFRCGNDSEHDICGNDVAGCRKECAAKNGFRHINFRIVNSIGVGTGGFHTEECPKGHGNGVCGRFAESHIIHIPVGYIHIG